MHGRLKVRSSEEQAEAKKREQQQKLKSFLELTNLIFSKRAAGEYDEDALHLTMRILEKNPEFYSLWNYRREILLKLKEEKTDDELKKLCLIELDLTQNCLGVNPKAYAAWNHRLWIMDFNPEADWNRELKLCNFFLSQDERNFHGWDYRRIVCKKCDVSPEEELDYSTSLIETNFSNYSAWHYRSKLLPIVHPDSSQLSVKEDVLLKEFELVQNAAFTDPDDQSVWFYHRWLLGRSKVPLQILCLSVIKPENIAIVLLSEPLKVNNKNLMLEINGTPVPTSWTPLNSSLPISTVWKSALPALEVGQGDGTFDVSVYLLQDEEKLVLNCDNGGSKFSIWKNPSRDSIFRSEFSAAAKNVLEGELESCQQLQDLEPDCKWTLFTCILLMRALNNTKYKKEIESFMDKLKEVDSSRKNYYKDLGSKFAIEDTIESLPQNEVDVNLSGRNLTSLHHFDQFILIENINLSSNSLTSIYPLKYLACAKSIMLDDNQLESLEAVEGLEHLSCLSVKRNFIQTPSGLEILKTCFALHKLFLEGNQVTEDEEYVPTLKKIPQLKYIDESPL